MTCRPGRILRRAGVALLFVAGALGLLGVARGAAALPATGAYRSQPLTTPVDTTIGLWPGRYLLCQSTGEARAGAAGAPPSALSPADIDLTDPKGARVPLVPAAGRSAAAGGGYAVLARLRVAENGVYRLHVDGAGGTAARVYVADDRSVSLLGRAAREIAPVLLGVLAGVAGLVALAAGSTRRPPVQPLLRAAPGWYADPSAHDRWRFFDGTTWTEHRNGRPAAGDNGGSESGPATGAEG